MSVFFNAIVAFLLVFVTVAMGVGVSGPLAINKDDDEYFITFWGFKDSTGLVTETGKIPCDTLRGRMYAGAGLSITALILQGFMFIITVAELVAINEHSKIMNTVFFLLHFFSLSIGLAGWALAVALFHQTSWCGGDGTYSLKNDNFKYGYGTALLISAWCVQILLVTIFKIISMCTISAASSEDGDSDVKELESGSASANSSKSASAKSSKAGTPKEKANNEPATDSSEKKDE